MSQPYFCPDCNSRWVEGAKNPFHNKVIEEVCPDCLAVRREAIRLLESLRGGQEDVQRDEGENGRYFDYGPRHIVMGEPWRGVGSDRPIGCRQDARRKMLKPGHRGG